MKLKLIGKDSIQLKLSSPCLKSGCLTRCHGDVRLFVCSSVAQNVFVCLLRAAKFPEKGWKLCSVKGICKWVNPRRSATERKPLAVDRKQHEQRKMLDTLSC